LEARYRYTTLTKIPLLDPDSLPDNPFAIFLDPHTGIPLPSESLKGSTVFQASLLFIVEINKEYRPSYMICFDQSYHRHHQLTTERQREAKRNFLREQGISFFYYISHAPFLFMAEKDATLVAIKRRLITLGIPERTSRTIRLECIMS
jgi:hypothetical protein